VLDTVALGLALPDRIVSPETVALISKGAAILARLNGVRTIVKYA